MSVNGSGETESHPYLNRLHILYIMAFQHLIDIGLFHVIDETDIFEYHLGVDNLILLRIVDQILCGISGDPIVQADEQLSSAHAENFLSGYGSFLYGKCEVEPVLQQNFIQNIFSEPVVFDDLVLKQLLQGDGSTLTEKLKHDLGFQVTRDLSGAYFDKVAPDYDDLQLKIAGLERDYMSALLKPDLSINR